MRSTLTGIRFVLLAVCAAGTASFAAEPVTDAEHVMAAIPARVRAQVDDQWSMLNEFCSECHNFEDWAGGVAFDTMRPDSIVSDAEIWEHAIRKLRGRLMPPPGKARPDQARIDGFIAWMESYLDHADAVNPNPGRVQLHRLNRTEYANAVEELLAIEVDPAAVLPQDGVSDGFDKVADALQVSPSFLDQYLSAARNLSAQAIGNPAPRPAGVPYVVRSGGDQRFHVEGLPLGTRGGMVVEHFFPADGEYELNIGNIATGLWEYNIEFEHTLIATLDGVKFYQTTIGGGDDLKSIDQQQAPAITAVNAKLKGIRFKAAAGPHKIAVTFLHRTFAESDSNLYVLTPGGGQDRIVRLASFEVRGPYDPTGLSDTPSRQRIFSCYPQTEADELPCAEQIIARLATQAYRRPLTDADMEQPLRFYRAGRQTRDFEAGVRGALTAILANPNFLYRIEPAPDNLAPGSIYPLSDLELASRLSFFLWSSLPDRELLDVAAQGRLRERKQLEKQVLRMLADPRSETLAGNFAFQWLKVGGLDDIDPDPKVFADIDPSLRDYLRSELRLFIDSVFREDRSVLDLLTADYTFVNEALALHYGIADVRGDRFRRIRLADENRFGLLGKGAVLMLSSNPNRTAPVIRGAWIMENIVGVAPTAPPPGVEALPENTDGGKALSVRDRMVAHQQNPTCHACHGILDPLGFALENFDAVGRWRTRDRFAGSAIDASGELPGGIPLHGPADLRSALVSRPDQFVQTLTQKLMLYALGRTIEYYDMPAVRTIVRTAAADDYRFSSIIMGIVNSPQFTMKKLPEGVLSADATTASQP